MAPSSGSVRSKVADVVPARMVTETGTLSSLVSLELRLTTKLEPRVPGIETVDLEDASLYEAMARVGQVPPVRSDYAVHADGADERVAALLNIDVGAPVLIGRELTYGKNGDRLLSAHLTYRGDAYTFRATLYGR